MKATGIFNWPGVERRSDRYGMVGLWSANSIETVKHRVELDQQELAVLEGCRAKIVVRVLETRKSGHVGDLFRGISPTTPNVGDVIDLGEGTLVTDEVEGTPIFGLRPDDGRNTDWFDPHKLYRLHDQTVELEIRPLH